MGKGQSIYRGTQLQSKGKGNGACNQETYDKLLELVKHHTRRYRIRRLLIPYKNFARAYKTQIIDGKALLIQRMNAKHLIVFEGAQGTLLDPRFGYSPYVTKTACTVDVAHKLLHETKLKYRVKTIGTSTYLFYRVWLKSVVVVDGLC